MTKEKQLEGWDAIYYAQLPEDVASIATDLLVGAYDADRYLRFITE